MTRPYAGVPEDPGIIPQALADVFSYIEDVWCSSSLLCLLLSPSPSHCTPLSLLGCDSVDTHKLW